MILALASCFAPTEPFDIRTSWVSQSDQELVLDINMYIRKAVCLHDQQLVGGTDGPGPGPPPYPGEISDVPYTGVSNIDNSFRVRLGLHIDPDTNHVQPPTYSLGVRCVNPGDTVHRRIRIPLPLSYRDQVSARAFPLPCNPDRSLRVEVSYSYGEQPQTHAYITGEGQPFDVWNFDGATLQRFVISDPIDLPVPPSPDQVSCRFTRKHIPSLRYWADPEDSNERFEEWERTRSPDTPRSNIIRRRPWHPKRSRPNQTRLSPR